MTETLTRVFCKLFTLNDRNNRNNNQSPLKYQKLIVSWILTSSLGVPTLLTRASVQEVLHYSAGNISTRARVTVSKWGNDPPLSFTTYLITPGLHVWELPSLAVGLLRLRQCTSMLHIIWVFYCLKKKFNYLVKNRVL